MILISCHFSGKESLSVSLTIMPQSVNVKYETPMHHTLTGTLSTICFYVTSTNNVSTKTKNPEDWKLFQTFRNITNVEKRKKKTTFYSDKLNESKNDMTITWKLLNMAIGTKSKTTNINSFTIDGKEIRNPKEIVDKLNQYFCNTAKRVQEEALNGNTENPDMDFQSYLTKSPNTDRTFRFKRVTPNDIVQSIAKLKKIG